MGQATRPPGSRRSWLMLPGSDAASLEGGARHGADVVVQEMEDSVAEERRPAARALCRPVLERWRSEGVVTAVRVNPLEVCGLEDLAAAMAGRPHVVMLAMTARAEQVRALDVAIGRHEAEMGLVAGATEIVPNIETAAGLVALPAIAAASPRVTALLLAAEDMASDLGASRTPDCAELAYARSRFLLECVAAGKVAIDYPYTYRDLGDAERDVRTGRSLGFRAKCVVNTDQVALTNRLLTPSVEERERARRTVEAFEAARAEGQDRADVDGLMVEVPTYREAKRVLARAAELG